MDMFLSVTLIGRLLDEQATAICNRDIASATANYAPDVIIFDVVGPLRHPAGHSSVRKRLENWFGTFAPEASVLFEITDREVSADDRLGFTHSLNHVHVRLRNEAILDMFWRETLAKDRRPLEDRACP
jgi:ketosteroid isomerase-like protein